MTFSLIAKAESEALMQLQKFSYGPRGLSCLTCRQRRKKCDRTRPVCERCLKGEFKCLGYDGDPPETPSTDGQSTPTRVAECFDTADADPGLRSRGIPIQVQAAEVQSANVPMPNQNTIPNSLTEHLGASPWYGLSPHLTPFDDSGDSVLGAGALALARSHLGHKDPPNAPDELIEAFDNTWPQEQSRSLARARTFDPGTASAHLISVRPGVPRTVNANAQMRESYFTFILSEYELHRLCRFFKPPPMPLSRGLTSRMKRSNAIFGFMYLGAKVFEALNEKPEGAVWKCCKGWIANFDRQATNHSPLKPSIQQSEDRLAGILELAYLNFLVVDTVAGYALLKRGLPVFLHLVSNDPDLWSERNGQLAVSLPQVLLSTRYEIRRFVFYDMMCALVLGTAPLAEYDPGELPPVGYPPFPVEPFHGIPIEWILIIAHVHARQCSWYDLEIRILSWRPRMSDIWSEESAESVFRIAIQESWRHAILIYIYMSMCGVNSFDRRVQASVKQIVRLVEVVHITPIDVHLSAPCIIAGIAAQCEYHRALIYEKLLSFRSTHIWVIRGADFAPILKHLWHGVGVNGSAVTWDMCLDTPPDISYYTISPETIHVSLYFLRLPSSQNKNQLPAFASRYPYLYNHTLLFTRNISMIFGNPTLLESVYPARLHTTKTVEKLHGLLPDVDRVKTQVLILSGSTTPFRNDTDRELPLRQESNFFYLTGCDVANSHLMITVSPPNATSNGPQIKSTLFIPREDPLETMWSPPPPTLEAARSTHETDVLAYSDQFEAQIADAVKSGETVVHILPQTNQFPNLPAALLAALSTSGVTPPPTIKYLLPALHAARLIKSEYEIELIRQANAISSRAHEVIMRVLGKDMKEVGGRVSTAKDKSAVMPGQWRIEKEAEAEAIFVASCRREGAVHQAYMPIVASAQHAATLHYCCNDRAFAWGPVNSERQDLATQHENGAAHVHNGTQNGHEHGPTLAPQVLLLDAGCEWRNYASDITRTTPVGNGGKFTPEARAIYELVLKMQEEAIDSLKPGVHWDAIQLQCHLTLIDGFLELGIFKGEKSDILKSEISSAFFPHGVGHSLGLDVHDVPSASKPEAVTVSSSLLALGPNVTIPIESADHPSFYQYLRLRLPLAVGMVLTVEPGIYFSPHLLAPVRSSPFIDHDVLARYEGVGGVRIEDVLWITETGCQNFTTVGKSVEWIEKLTSGSA
ncbi:unnamed protein product [Rhizoctonia solani]|uniref:Zn(2)-C6 fungal-type domain-containing protein n=1 Tax=Rhizoctonia solani TaxID=456999 RepID=A0A8H3ECJ6_9AGAM|nr:unnamed protein product [Rhizoctonia solani]